MVPGVLRPVPSVPEGIYLRSVAASAYNMGDHEFALTLFERSALASPSGSLNYVESHATAARIARELGLEERAIAHERLIEDMR